MSALNDLERQLTRSVDGGMASRAAQERRAESARRTRRRAWLHGPRLLLIALIGVGGTTGALAATGVLRIAPADRMQMLAMVPHAGAGVIEGGVKVSSLRVADPNGGPPWTLRTFRTTRGVSCLQGGQIYRGRFGQVGRDEEDRQVFRLLAAGPGGDGVRCTLRTVDGLPVVPDLRIVAMDGGAASRSRCGRGAGLGSGGCPIRSVTVVRFGTLGPAAERVRWFGGAGASSSDAQQPAAGSGGAYLFARKADPAPWRELQHLEMSARDDAQRRYPMVARGTKLAAAERRAAQTRDRRRIAYLMERLDADRARKRALYQETLGDERIEATFASGERLVVAGRGAKRGALPGVVIAKERIPADVRGPVALEYRDSRRPVVVSFRSPVAIERAGQALVVTIRGPKAPACTDHEVSAERWLDHDRTKGSAVRVNVGQGLVLNRVGGEVVGDGKRPGVDRWCRGARYVLRVRYSTSRSGQRVERLVGQRAFIAR